MQPSFQIDHDRVEEILNNPVGTTAGHASMFKYSEDKIMKFSNPYEVQVYQAISKFEDITSVVPAYYGFVDLTQGESSEHFLGRRLYKPDSTRVQKGHAIFVILENLLLPFSVANIADIKLGLRNYEVGDEVKKERIDRDHTTGADIYLGRFDGISIHGGTGLHKKDLWVHSFSDNMKHFLIPEFDYQGEVELSVELKERLIKICKILVEKLTKISLIMEKYAENFNFLQSSLLLLYEADLTKEPIAEARLIDFDRTRYKINENSSLIVPQPQDQIANVLGDLGAARGPISLVKELNDIIKRFQ